MPIARVNPLRSGPVIDLDGWRDAHARLNTALGVQVEFRVPTPKVYAANVAVDPETGEPYDPTAVPIPGGPPTAVIITVGPVFRPIRAVHPTDASVTSEAGLRREEDVALLIEEKDYPSVKDATEFTLFDIDYKLTEIIEDGLVARDRYIAYGEAR